MAESAAFKIFALIIRKSTNILKIVDIWEAEEDEHSFGFKLNDCGKACSGSHAVY